MVAESDVFEPRVSEIQFLGKTRFFTEADFFWKLEFWGRSHKFTEMGFLEEFRFFVKSRMFDTRVFGSS